MSSCLSFQWHLAKSLNLSSRMYGFLLNDVELLKCTDVAMLREGIDTLSLADLQQVEGLDSSMNYVITYTESRLIINIISNKIMVW